MPTENVIRCDRLRSRAKIGSCHGQATEGSPVSTVFGEPVFNEAGAPTPDPTTFRTPHDKKSDDQLYSQVQKLLTKDTVKFSASRGKPGDLYGLASALGSQGPTDVQAIQESGQIVFHAVGDTGAAYLTKLVSEETVADRLTNDFHTSKGADRPAFVPFG